MKRSDLFREWARVLDMCEGLDVSAHKCVRVKNQPIPTLNWGTPSFDGHPDNYSFAIVIVEDKPVFVGDQLYIKDQTNLGKVQVSGGSNIGMVLKAFAGPCIEPPENLTWDYPKSLRMATESGFLPMPTYYGRLGNSLDYIFSFGTEEHLKEFARFIGKSVENAR